MSKLKKCIRNHYTMKDICPTCKKETRDAHYKFIKPITNKKIKSD